MKAREMPRVYVLRGLLTAIKNRRVERRGAELGDADLLELVRREIRQREEAEAFAAKAGRSEIVAQNRAEREMLEAYVPPQLGAGELEQVIRDVASTPVGRSMGAIMGALRERFPRRFHPRQPTETAPPRLP